MKNSKLLIMIYAYMIAACIGAFISYATSMTFKFIYYLIYGLQI